jgi:protein O-GlcNAc transferase
MNNPQFLFEQGLKNHQSGNLSQAENFYRQALKADPDNPDGLHLLGLVVNETGDPKEAIKLLERATKGNPANADFSNNLGQLYKAAGRIPDAIKAYGKALKARPDFADAHSNLGNALAVGGDTEQALTHYREALRIDPNNARAQYNLATALSGRGEHSQAIEAFRSVLTLAPDYPEALNNLAFSLLEQGAMEEASDHLQKALELNPEFAAAHANVGNLFAKLSDWKSSFDHYSEATTLEPGRAETWTGLGNAQENLGHAKDALVSYRRAVEADPEDGTALSGLCVKLMNACAWEELTPALERLDGLNRQAGEDGKKACENPFMSLTRTSDLAANAKIAWSWSGDIERAVAGMDLSFAMDAPRQSKPILTIGYLSSDFRDHVIGHLMKGMFALHDREAFRIIAYSSGEDDGSDYRGAIKDNCDEFLDINGRSSTDVAQRIQDDQVDILVDLNGYTIGSRLEIAALRPAPVQISYLGFPGTVGGFFDYVILDEVVLDHEEEAHFREKVIYIPPYYVVNDGLPEASPASNRKENGLPDDGFVFCSFNKANKIEPVMFECWMTVLKETPGSVLWLIDDNPVATGNLKQAASGLGVDPDRLVFAGRVAKDQHLSRHKLADLGLDTRLYNGGATSWDVLAAGLPVITLRGKSITSRATASMLTSLGASELITHDLEAYQALALKLAGDAKELQRVGDLVRENAKTSALFNTEASVRSLEKAYQRVWEDFAGGIGPRSVHI